MTRSLHSFCKEHGLAKSTVHSHLTALGHDLSNGLTEAAVADARSRFVTAATAPTAQAVAAQVVVETGNHCSQLATPQQAGAFSLESFRDEGITALTFADPGAVADEFLAVADQLLAGMDADVKARQQRLDATKAAQAKVSSKAQELSLEARLYRLQSGQLDTAQTSETKALQDAVGALQSLGKPPADTAA